MKRRRALPFFNAVDRQNFQLTTLSTPRADAIVKMNPLKNNSAYATAAPNSSNAPCDGAAERLEQTLGTRVIYDVDELCERLELPCELADAFKEASRDFPIAFPESLLARVPKGTIDDPVLRQFLPDARELEKTTGFSDDPLCEFGADTNARANSDTRANSRELADCVLHKYAGRVLFLTTNACAARCRFCFRRRFPKNRVLIPFGTNPSKVEARLTRAFAPFRDDPTITEIIFSGGDPLTLSNAILKNLFHSIKNFRYVNRARLHSRVPILAPSRIDANFPAFVDFSSYDEESPLILHIVLHVNSSKEIDSAAKRAILTLREKGYALTSQTVLLRGVNDSADALVELYETLIDLGVIPYYLHQLDRVQGAAHFETSVERGRELIREISARLPGYAVPKYAREIPGQPMKTNLFDVTNEF